MTKRGEPLPINQALNRARAKLGLDLTAWMAILFVCVTVFLVGFRVIALMAFPSLAVSAWLIVRKHPKMFELWGLSLNQKSSYMKPGRTANTEVSALYGAGCQDEHSMRLWKTELHKILLKRSL